MNALKCVNPYQNLTIENVDGVDIKVSTFEDAISYVVKPNHDKNYISEAVLKELKKNRDYKEWQKQLPTTRIPNIFWKYKNRYSKQEPNAHQILNDVDLEIKKCGIYLPVGQQLCHGGVWWERNNNFAITTYPLSLTFSPTIALRLLNRGKYCGDRVDLFFMTIKEEGIRAFPYPLTCEHRIETEVLIQSGIKLNLVNDTLVRTDFKIGVKDPEIACNYIDKDCELHIVEFDVTKG